jgi:hypothetical protein
LLLVEGPGDKGLGGLLGALGVQLGDDVVVDLSPFGSVFGGPDTAAGVAYAEHAITTPLRSAMTLFPRARSIALNPIPDVAQAALVLTGEKAWGERSLAQGALPPAGTALQLDEGEVAGPVPLAAAIERATEDGKHLVRAVVVGDATFCANQAYGAGANKGFARNALAWLAEDDAQLSVRPPSRGGNVLFLTPTQREGIAFVTFSVIPTLLLCAGLSVWVARRR